MTDVPNPWSPDNWNLTAQGEYVKKYGVSVAARKARQAGTMLGALKPRPVSTVLERHWIIQKNGGGGGGSIIGAGSSGDGPPE
jgi:hypothetical protein